MVIEEKASEKAPPSKSESVYFEANEDTIGPMSPRSKSKSVYYEANEDVTGSTSPPPTYPPPYESEIDTKTITIQEFNSLRAEIRAATEIAAVSKFHVKEVEDQNKILEGTVKQQQERLDR